MNEEKRRRLEIMKDAVRRSLAHGLKPDRKAIIASMIVNFGVARRLASEELDAVITWTEGEEVKQSQLTTHEEQRKNTE